MVYNVESNLLTTRNYMNRVIPVNYYFVDFVDLTISYCV